MSIFERIADMPLEWVAVIVGLLWLGRWLLRKQTHSLAKHARELCESLAIAGALVFFIVRPFIVQAFFIPSESMLPTLRVHDHVLANKFLYRFREPRRGDVVVFKAPAAASPDGKRRDFIKRVIAVPGDSVRITPGHVSVGGVTYNHTDVRACLGDVIEEGAAGAVKFAKDGILVDGKPVSRSRLATALGVDPRKVQAIPGKVYVNGKPIREPYLNEDPDGPYHTTIPSGRLLVMGDNRNNSNDSRFWGLLDRRDVLGKAMVSYWPLGRIGIVR